MAYPRINGSTINGDDAAPAGGLELVTGGRGTVLLSLSAGGARPLELGIPRLKSGSDTELRPEGLELVRSGIHSLAVGQPPALMTLQARGSEPLELGGPSILPSAIILRAGSSSPLSLGNPTYSLTVLAPSFRPLELGLHSTSQTLHARQHTPLSLGTPTISRSFSASGIDLVRAGTARINTGRIALEAQGTHALELGSPGTPTVVLRPRQAFVLGLGRPSIHRSHSC